MKTIKLFLISGFLLIFFTNGIMAQQGNVAAGGDATGTGGSLSFSAGQTDYLYYSSENGSLHFGLQQAWMPDTEPPEILEISDWLITDGESLCFNATETVIVAGDGDFFVIQDGGHAEIIAGNNILLRFGTTVEYGGSLHAHISTVWCEPGQGMLASLEEEILPDAPIFEAISKSAFFKVYPNPTTGDFTLELLEFEEDSGIQLEIYSAQGQLVLSKHLQAQKLYNLNITGRQPGIYLIRVLKGHETGTGKIIKQ